MSDKSESGVKDAPGNTSTNPGIKRIAGYEIISKLGSGAMGAVFKARQISLDREVALKVLPPKIAKDEKFIERFQREARASAIMNHPHIVQGIDVGRDAETGLWYFAMEFVDGPTLKQVLAKEGRLAAERVLEIGRDIGRALECAERNNIVHRDIKPDNILLNSRNEPKLADLGLAKKTSVDEEDAGLTQAGKAVGTPHYMAPEQVRGLHDQIDIRTDFYALGATLFHLATGQTPYQGGTAAEIMSKHLTEKAPLAHRVNSEVPEPLSRLIGRLMEKEPAKRPQNASEVIDAFEKALGRSGATTGPRKPIRPGNTTGPRAPVRANTTGPRKPVRGVTTGPRVPVAGREDGGDGARQKQAGQTPLLIGGVVGVAVVIGLVVAMMGGGSPPPRPQAQNEPPKPGTPAPAVTAAKADPAEARRKEDAAKQAAVEAAADKAFDQLIKFDGLNADDHTQRLERVEKFLADHGEANVAARARTMAERLKKALAETKTAEAAPAPADAPPAAPAPDPKALAQAAAGEAWKKVQTFEGLKGDDVAGRIAAVEAFLKQHADTDAAGEARKALANLQADQKAAAARQSGAATAEARMAYAKFAEQYLDVLRAGARGEALKLLQAADKQPALAPMRNDLRVSRNALQWQQVLENDALKGAEKLKEIEQFELRMMRGDPMQVGKGQEFQVTDVKDGAIYVGSKGMSMPVKIAQVHPATRRQLVEMAGLDDGGARLRKAFMLLLDMGGSVEADAELPGVEDVKQALAQAAEKGAKKEDVAYLESLIAVGAMGAAESQAQAAWSAVAKLAEGEQWDALTPALSDFTTKHGTTAFADSKKGEVLQLMARAADARKKAGRASLNEGLALHFTFDKRENNFLVDESPKGFRAWVLKGARTGPGGKEGDGLHLAGDALVTLNEKEAHLELGAGSDHTVAAWIKTREDGTILSRAPWKGNWQPQGRCFFLRGGRVAYDSGWVGVVEGRTHINNDQWHHVAYTLDKESKTVVLYVDGQEDARRALPKLEPDKANRTTGVRIGYCTGNFPNPSSFHGVIDEVRVYQRMLSPEEIRALATDGASSASGPAAPAGKPADASDQAPSAKQSEVKPAGGVSEAFLKEVSKLKGEQQWSRVLGELRRLNPKFTPERGHSFRPDRQGNIHEMRFRTNELKDVSPLRAVETVRVLNLRGNRRDSLDTLAGLVGLQLTTLDVSNNNISDLAPLEGMPLTSLNLQQTNVSDLSPLAGMKIDYLNLDRTEVIDLSPLKDAPLRHLIINNTKVTDLSPLKGSSIKRLDAWKTGVTDFTPLKDTQVSELYIGGNTVKDLAFLKGFGQLKRLHIGDTQVSDLSPLKDCRALDQLEMHSTPVTDLSPIRGLGLERLNISNTQVKDLAPLKGMQLRWLYMDRTPVTDLGPLAGMPIRDITLSLRPDFVPVLRTMKEVKSINRKRADQVLDEADDSKDKKDKGKKKEKGKK